MAKKKKKIKEQKSQAKVKPAGKSFLEELLESNYYVLYYAIFIFILTVILFSEFVFSGQMLFSSDTINAGLFFRNFPMEYFREHGSIPLWNPYIFCGMPFVDAFHGDIFYPISFVFKLILPTPIAFGWSLIFHVFLAGLFMYLCARGFGMSKLAATFAGIFYMFAPYLVSMVQPGHDGKMYVTALLPLAMLFLERGMNRGRLLDFTLLGAMIGMIIITPHPQMSYFSLWALGFYAAFRLILKFIDDKSIVVLIKPAVFFLLAVILGLGVSAIQFYPGYRYVKEFSPRAHEEDEDAMKERERWMYATSWSMNAEELAAQFIPNFCGTDARGAVEGDQTPPTYWGKNAFKDNSEYIGILPLFFGLMAIIFVRTRRTWFFMGLGAFALVYALGGSTPLYHIFYNLIPNVKHLRAASMIMFVFSFSFCLLAGYGIDFLRRLPEMKDEQKKKILNYSLIFVAIYGLLALLFSVAGRGMLDLFKSIFAPSTQDAMMQYKAYPLAPDLAVGLWIVAGIFLATWFLLKSYAARQVGVWALAIVIFFGIVDTWRMNYKFITTTDQTQYVGKNGVVDLIRQQRDAYTPRILNADRGILRGQNYFGYHDVPMMFGYHGNQLKIFDDYWGRVGKSNDHSYIFRMYTNRQNPNDPQNGTLQWLNIPFIDMAGVEYIVTDYGANPGPYRDMLRRVSSDQQVSRDRLILYENKSSFGRSILFYDYEVIEDRDSMLEFMRSGDHEWQKTVLLSADPEIEIPPADSVNPVQGSSEITFYDPNRIEIEVYSDRPAILYLADCYYPDWKAYIDDEELEVILANGAFRAVAVPAGEHTVEFEFDSAVYSTSSMVSWASILFVVIVSGFSLYNRRVRKPERE